MKQGIVVMFCELERLRREAIVGNREVFICPNCAFPVSFVDSATWKETVFRAAGTDEIITGREAAVECPRCGAETVVVIEDKAAV
jgi:predicted RNA-binding Zn-ribbon protein involved in translation (DUF1610 family)